jgi:hypothetical protein
MEDNELTEKETLGNVVKFLEYVLENGTAEEIREVNVLVCSQVMKVEKTMRKYWPDIIAPKIIIKE